MSISPASMCCISPEPFFVTRAKSNMDAHRVYSAPTDRTTGIICDQTIALDGHYTSQDGETEPVLATEPEIATGIAANFEVDLWDSNPLDACCSEITQVSPEFAPCGVRPSRSAPS